MGKRGSSGEAIIWGRNKKNVSSGKGMETRGRRTGNGAEEVDRSQNKRAQRLMPSPGRGEER